MRLTIRELFAGEEMFLVKRLFQIFMIDPDDDGFSSQNGSDAFPLDPTEWLNTDFDGIEIMPI